MATVGVLPDPIFADARLARIYDRLDGDRSDLDAYLAIVDELDAPGQPKPGSKAITAPITQLSVASSAMYPAVVGACGNPRTARSAASEPVTRPLRIADSGALEMS